MKSIVSALVMVSFLALAGFGLFAMGHDVGHGTGWCVSTNPRGALCSGENALAVVRSHVAAFMSALAAIFDSFGKHAALFIVTIFAALAGIRFFAGEGNSSARKIVFSFFRQAHIPLVVPSEQEILRWLRLRETSPTVL